MPPANASGKAKADIDDIFASKPKSLATGNAAGPSTLAKSDAACSSKKSKKTGKEAKAAGDVRTASGGVDKKKSKRDKREKEGVSSSAGSSDSKANANDPITIPDTLQSASEPVIVVDASSTKHIGKRSANDLALASDGSGLGKSTGKKKRKVELDEEELAFRDSRGDANRKKTEEGFLVFKEGELKIDPTAGGTDLCPFDCECSSTLKFE